VNLQIVYGASFVEYYAEEGKRIYGDIIPSPFAEKRMLVMKHVIHRDNLLSVSQTQYIHKIPQSPLLMQNEGIHAWFHCVGDKFDISLLVLRSYVLPCPLTV
jgi:hypothetical protein